MATNYKVEVRFNNQNLGSAVNVFYAQDTNVTPDPDQDVLDRMETWIQNVYGSLRPLMDTGFVFASGRVLEVDNLGVLVRIIGGINPDISGLVTAQTLTLPAAGSATARTATPRVQGRKRFGGLVEGSLLDGLYDNALLTALGTALIQWLIGPGFGIVASWLSGVISSKLENFAPFDDNGLVTNIPGTQVTRKPGRGS